MENTTKEEPIIWKGSPSQIMYLHIHLLNVAIIVLLAFLTDYLMTLSLYIKLGHIAAIQFTFIGISIYLFLKLYFVEYTLYESKIGFQRGIFNLKYDETELYRIKDYSLRSPFFLRLFSLSNLRMESSDRIYPNIELKAIKKGKWLFREIESRVEEQRRIKGVREFD
jgi:uncharacterized membrane protein YdbT with pleckstrin-like domain